MKVKIRKALLKDVEFFFNLRNQKIVRKNSFNKKIIDFNSHVNWYKKKLKNKDSIFLIGYIKKSQNVGTIRYEKEKEIFKVSVAIDKPYRKKGFGSQIMKKSENFLEKRNIIIAKIRKNNKFSLKLFKKNSYLLLKKKNNLTLIKII
jgi:GNAT superfamily N-acetyltransferase